MSFDHDARSCSLRMDGALDYFFPTKALSFRWHLVRTNAMLMGSFPLFCLKENWNSAEIWDKPGGVDIFLAPTSTQHEMAQNKHILHQFLMICGYTLQKQSDEPRLNGYQTAFLGRVLFSVMTYLKSEGDKVLKIQLVANPRIPYGPNWHLQTMAGFDLTCCSIAFDGKTFHTTNDNTDPTSQKVFVRAHHKMTTERQAKYNQRGFKYDAPFAPTLFTTHWRFVYMYAHIY